MSTSLVIRGIESTGVTIAPEAVSRKRMVLDESRLVNTVASQFTQTAATESLRELVRIEREVEKDRQAIKQPVLALGRQIDDTAATFLADVKQESARLKTLLSNYEVEQRKKAEEERRRQEEAQRQAQEAERKRLEEIERQKRIAEEAARQAEQAATPQQATEAIKATVEAETKVEELAAPVAQPLFRPPVVTRAEGQVVRETWDYEVTDIARLASEHPELVTIVPKRADILRIIAQGAPVTGLRVFKKTSVGVRL